MTENIVNGITVIFADSGKVFVQKNTNTVLTERLYLGCNDSKENYTEVNITDLQSEREVNDETLQDSTGVSSDTKEN